MYAYNKYMKKWAITIIFAYMFVLILAGCKLLIAITHPLKYSDLIAEISSEYNLSAELVASVVNVESRYNPNAKSSKGAIGLMQVKLSTAEYLIEIYNLDIEITEDDLYTPKTNLTFGCMYLNYLLQKFEDCYTALAAYNAGETRVLTWLKDSQYSSDGITLNVIPYQETKNYINKIKSNLTFYSKYL